MASRSFSPSTLLWFSDNSNYRGFGSRFSIEEIMARPKKSAPEPVQSDLVLMAKDGVTLEVNPTCVKAHKDAGWKVVE